MLNATRYQKAVAGAHIEHSTRVLESNAAADDVHHLLVRMTMARADPTFFHGVTHQHHGWTVGHDLSAKSGLGRRHTFLIRRDNFNCVRWHGCSFLCVLKNWIEPIAKDQM